MTKNSTGATGIRPFRIDIPQADLDDLRERLARTRLPQPAPATTGTYGVPNAWLSETIDAVAGDFDWRAQEARMNEFPHYLTEIDGQTVHFIHVPSKEEGATPLLLLHTYPGSFVDFLDLIDPLIDPVAHGGRAEDAFSVVVPSMPGFGFSTPVVDRGWTMARVATYVRHAHAPARLRRRYGTHGSDGGAMISRELGLLNPEGFLGLHVLQLFSFPSGDPAEFEKLEPKDYAALEHMQWFQSVGGYNQINASRPQTVAVGTLRLPGRAARVERAVHQLRQRHEPGLDRADPHRGLARLVHEHVGDGRPLPPRGGACRRRAGGQPRPDRRRGLRRRLQVDPDLRRP